MNPGELPEHTQNSIEPEQLPEDWLQAPLQPPPVPSSAVYAVKHQQTRYAAVQVDPLWPRSFFSDQHPLHFQVEQPADVEEKLIWLQERLQLQPGARVLDYNCGHGVYSQALAEQGYWVVGTDASTHLLDEARNRSIGKSSAPLFVQTDLRSAAFIESFDAAYSLGYRFGFLDDQNAIQCLKNIAHCLRPNGCLVLHLLNRDALVSGLPTRQWWGDSSLAVHEEVWLHDLSSRVQVKQEIFSATRAQTQQQYSLRVYSEHELHGILSSLGFEILEISGAFFAKRAFFGVDSFDLVVVAQKKAP